MLVAAAAVLSPLASAYYYWVYYAGRSGPYNPIPAKFDLSSLSNQTIPYLISSQGPAVMAQGDTFTALISQIRAAANVWNGVSTSAAKLSFGGLSPMSQPDASPEIDVVFDDNMAPGLLAYTRLTTVADVSGTLAGGAQFVPILSARVQLHNDLTSVQPPQASSSDAFFLTIVHEFGHALGLQHTLTSSVMSTQTTSATTKAIPLAADDIAGISLLYPAGGFQASMGTITGMVSLGGARVNMASVVALSTNGTAVSALTNPDGTYRIDGIPPGQYYVYTHPLPPAVSALGEAYPDNIVPPQDPNGGQFPPTLTFGTQFYGGTQDWTASSQISVSAGNSTDGVNFNVSHRSGPAISAVAMYSYIGPNGATGVGTAGTSVSSGPLQSGSPYYLIFAGNGVSSNNKAAPGLSVSVIGGSAKVTLAPSFYESFNGVTFLQMAVAAAKGITSYTPVALAMMLDGDVYVLPSAFSVVPAPPPAITSVNGSTDGSGNTLVSIYGTNLNANTKILFDGALANVLQTNADGSIVVSAPPATNGYQAVVEALAPDSQTSAQLLGTAPGPAFIYGGPSAPSITASPSSLAAGTDSMVEIVGVNTNFVDGQTVVGFGSSDITVKQVWVVGPGLLRMNVSVNAAAAIAPTIVSVASGLQLATLNTMFQVTPGNSRQITLRAPIVNQATGLAGVPTGGYALISTSGLPFTATNSTVAGWTLTIANQPVPFTVGDRGQILAQVPAGLLSGPSIVQLFPAGGGQVPPVLLQIDPPSPTITSATSSSGLPPAAGAAGAAPTFHAGDSVTLIVAGLSDALGNFPAVSAIDVNVGGIDIMPSSLTSLGGFGAACQLRITLPSSLGTGPQAITIRVGTRVSAAFTITVQ